MENQIKNEDFKIELRTLTKDDYLGLKTSMMEAYSEWEGASFWGESQQRHQGRGYTEYGDYIDC